MIHTVTFPGLGLSFEINRIAFSLGSINIYWYGVLIALGLMLALVFAFRHCVEFGIDADAMIDVIMVGTVMAIVCARIYYVAMSPFEYQSIWEMLDIRQGGIAIYGALIGAFVFGALMCKKREVPIAPMCDLAAMGFLIGQGIGRWGNFVNQEAFGYNTTLPWGMYSDATRSYLQGSTVTVPAGVTIDPSLPVHPTFLYESLWCLAGFGLLFLYYKKRRFNGDVALLYAIWYGCGRFWIESLRTDSLLLVPSLGLRASQLVAAVTVLAALAAQIVLTRRAKGRALMVRLAVTGENRALQKQLRQKSKDGPVAVSVAGGEVYAALPRKEFIKRTEQYNLALGEALKAQLESAE
jgi:phosphatidylglycerol:prolipoprotein diacylglycerol transferase